MAKINTTAPSFTIDENAITRLGSVDVGEALKFITGAQIKDYGGIGGIKSISYRSLGGSHTAVTVDNFLMLDLQTGSANLSAFEAFSLSEISFSTGQPSDFRQTASAYIPASLISSKSKLLDKDSSVKAMFYQNVTTINAYETGVLTSVPIAKKGFFGAQIFSRYGNGEYNFRSAIGSESLVYRRTNTDLFSLKSRLAGGYEWKNSKLALNVIHSLNNQELPGAVILYNPFSDQHLKRENLRGDVTFTKSFQNSTLKTHAFHTQDFVTYHDPNYFNQQGFIHNEYKQRQTGGGYIAHHKVLNGYHKLFHGSDIISANLNGNNFENAPNRLLVNSVLGGKSWFQRWKAEWHITHQFIKDRSFAQNEIIERSYSKLSPYLSAAFFPSKNKTMQIRSFFKRVFRMPTFSDLYYNFIGNTNLSPEDAYLFDLGFTFGNKSKNRPIDFELNIDGFYNRVDNKIIAIPTKDLFNWSMQNIGKTKAVGVDGGFTISQKIKNWSWMYSLSATYNEVADISDESSLSYGHQIPYTPFLSGNSSALLGFRDYRFSLNLLYSGKRYSLNENIPSNELPPFFDINIGLDKSFSLKKAHKFIVSIKAMNMLNKNYEVIRSFPMPGRYYQFTLRYNYK